MSHQADDRPFLESPPDGFSLADVVVRLASTHERVQWDGTMDQHHYLGFKPFAGPGLCDILEWCGVWTALAGWQMGAFKCPPRDRLIGWEQQFKRLHLIANSTRRLILGAKGVFPCLASLAHPAILRQFSDDWRFSYRHSILAAEIFVDPAYFDGTLYEAANWHYLGDTKGFARHKYHR